MVDELDKGRLEEQVDELEVVVENSLHLPRVSEAHADEKLASTCFHDHRRRRL